MSKYSVLLIAKIPSSNHDDGLVICARTAQTICIAIAIGGWLYHRRSLQRESIDRVVLQLGSLHFSSKDQEHVIHRYVITTDSAAINNATCASCAWTCCCAKSVCRGCSLQHRIAPLPRTCKDLLVWRLGSAVIPMHRLGAGILSLRRAKRSKQIL